MSDMTVEDLRSDIERNAAELTEKTFFSSDDVKKYLVDTIFPLLENVGEVLDVHDEDIENLINMAEGADDILQPQTAGIFAIVIKSCMEIAADLGKRLRPGNAGDEKWKRKLAFVAEACKAAEAKLFEITVQPDQPEDDIEEETPLANGAPASTPANDQAPAEQG